MKRVLNILIVMLLVFLAMLLSGYIMRVGHIGLYGKVIYTFGFWGSILISILILITVFKPRRW